MKRMYKAGLIGLMITGAVSVVSFRGTETSRELIAHEVNEFIPIREHIVEEGLDFIVEVEPGSNVRIPSAERKVYQINRFLEKPLYEVVLEQDSGIVICDVVYLKNGDRVILPMGPSTVGPHMGESRYITSDPNKYSFEHLFNQSDPFYVKLK